MQKLMIEATNESFITNFSWNTNATNKKQMKIDQNKINELQNGKLQ